MKKITFLLTMLTFISFYPSALRADSYKYRPYLGADYQYARPSLKGLSSHHNALSLHLGSDYSAYFSSELFFNKSDKANIYPAGQKMKISYLAYGLDLLAYLPITNFSLIATAGAGEYVFKTRLYPTKHHNEHGFGYRFGGGLKYAYDEHWQARLISRYVKFDRVHQFNHAMEYTFGVEYHF